MKKLLLEYGAYLLINIESGHVCAAGVLDNGYQKHSTPWTKIDTIVVCKYRNRYGSLLMKHMVEAAEGQVIFVYAMTDRNVITLDLTRDDEEQEEGQINLRDATPFYSRYGFMVDHEFQRVNAEYIQEGTVPMVASKNRLRNSLRLVENKDVKRIKFFILICTHFTK